MTDEPTRALRADAARNRERLLAAAAELFAQRGLGVSLNDIAHHAGVGVGTAYRRFAHKDEVIAALFEQRLAEMVAVADEARQDPDAWRGLVTFLERSLALQFGDLGLTQVMNNPAIGDERVQHVRDRLAPMVTDIVAAAQAQGSVRPDLDQSDLIFVQVALAAVMESSRAVAPALYRRYLALLLDGIAADGAARRALPVPPLSADDTHRAMTRGRARR